MPQVRLTSEELGSRILDLQRLARPLALNAAAVMPASGPYNGFAAVGVYGGGRQPVNPRDWRFSCKGQLSGNLYELWQPYMNGRRYYLHSFCLNIYDIEVVKVNPPEFLLLHAEPETKASEPHGKYKQGPHIHIEVPGTIWPEVHLGLSLGNLREAISTPKNISIALKHAVDMIVDQITPLR